MSSSEVQTDIKFISSESYGHWTLTYRAADNKLTGEVDPTYNLRRKNWRIAKVDMSCDEGVANTTAK